MCQSSATLRRRSTSTCPRSFSLCSYSLHATVIGAASALAEQKSSNREADAQPRCGAGLIPDSPTRIPRLTRNRAEPTVPRHPLQTAASVSARRRRESQGGGSNNARWISAIAAPPRHARSRSPPRHCPWCPFPLSRPPLPPASTPPPNHEENMPNDADRGTPRMARNSVIHRMKAYLCSIRKTNRIGCAPPLRGNAAASHAS